MIFYFLCTLKIKDVALECRPGFFWTTLYVGTITTNLLQNWLLSIQIKTLQIGHKTTSAVDN